MALYTGFFNSNPEAGLIRKYDAEDISRLFDGLIGDGVLETVGEKLMVKPNNGMVVSVGTGRAWFSHCWIRNDSKLDLTVPESDPLLPRKDTVVLEVNHNLNVLDCSIKIIPGAPAAVPVAATLEDTEYIKQVPLAYISVAAGATEVVITDLTNCVGTSACPFVIGIASFMTIDDFVAQWGAEWTAWLAAKGTQYDNMFTAKSEQFDAWFLAKNDAWTDFMAEKNTEWTAWLAQQSSTLQNIQNEINSFTQTLITGVMCTDVNDTFDTGNYGINAQTQGTLPTGVSTGSMEVINSPSGNTKQVLYPDSGENIIYTRSYDSTTEAWSTWKAASGGGGGGTAGGSIIKVTTTETSLHNKNVTITNGTETASATFDGNGVAVIEGFTGVGSCTISASDGYLSGEKSITIPYFGNYTETIRLWKATVTITVQDAYDGQTVEIYDEHMSPIDAVDCTAAAGGATWTANAPGTYIFSVMIGTYPDVETVEESLTIVDEGTYEVALTRYELYGFFYNGEEADSSKIISYDVSYKGRRVDNYGYTSLTGQSVAPYSYDGLSDWLDAFFIPTLRVDGTNTPNTNAVNCDVVGFYKSSSTHYKAVLDPDKYNGGSDNSVDVGIVDSTSYSIFSRFPKIWIRVIPTDSEGNELEDATVASSAKVFISNRKLDDDFHAHGYIDDDGVEHNELWVGTFPAQKNSVTGKICSSIDDSGNDSSFITTIGDGITKAHELDYSNYHHLKYSLIDGTIQSMLTILALLMFKTPNIQSAAGLGCVGYGYGNQTARSFRSQRLGGHFNSSDPDRQYTSDYTAKDMIWISPKYESSGSSVILGVENLWGQRWLYLYNAVHAYVYPEYYEKRFTFRDGTTHTYNMLTNAHTGQYYSKIGWSKRGITVFGIVTSSNATSSTYTGDSLSAWATGNTIGSIGIGGRSSAGTSSNQPGYGEKAGLFCEANDSTGYETYGFGWWGMTRLVAWPKEGN